MNKKFLSAIVLFFAFLFLNLSFNSYKVNAEDTLPEEIYKNAGIGEKKGYWALVNYGEDYVGNINVVINIQRDALEDKDVNFIMIAESGWSDSVTYYERNVHQQFSSKIEYTLKNTECGEKSIAILLLKKFTIEEMDGNAIVDKIIININHKKTICGLNSDDIIVRQRLGANSASAKIEVTLKDPLNYVLKKVKYRFIQNDEVQLSAIEESFNNFYFTAYQDGSYEIIVEDYFGCVKTIYYEVSGITPPKIAIEAIPSITTPTNVPYYSMQVNVYAITISGRVKLNSTQLDYLSYVFTDEAGNKNENKDIKAQMLISVADNGTYTIYASYLNSEANYVVVIDNIDRVKPFIEVVDEMTVYTESVNLFTPKNEVFVSDNVTSGSVLAQNLTVAYYTTKLNGTETVRDKQLSESEYRNYLYTVRNIIIAYTVTDEAGNSITQDCKVVSIDNTKPVISYGAGRLVLYINDPYPTAKQLEAAYNITVTDNSLYEGSNRKITYTLDFSSLPAITDENGQKRLSQLGSYPISIRALDEAKNESEAITLNAEIRERLIRIEAVPNQFAIYGEYSASTQVIKYRCLAKRYDEYGQLVLDKDGKYIYDVVDCKDQLLEGDSIIGDPYVEGARFVGEYEIRYDRMSASSKLYYLEYDEINKAVFTIKPRIIPLMANSVSKQYLEKEPELTYEIITSYCDDPVKYAQGYRCENYGLIGQDTLAGAIQRYKGPAPVGYTTYTGVSNTDESEYVWYDESGSVASRAITIGSLSVLEVDDGGKDNYVIEFVNGSFTIYPKHAEVTVANATKYYGDNDPVYGISHCEAYIYKNGEYVQVEDCIEEFQIDIKRTVEGEVVRGSTHYKIEGDWRNKNYDVVFTNGYLEILKRPISIKVEGDLDEDNNPTGLYTIIYENTLPDVKVYDATRGQQSKGLADNELLEIKDNFYYGKAIIYDPVNDEFITSYVNGVGEYKIHKGSIVIANKDGINMEANYDIDFEEGTLKVIRRNIVIEILEDERVKKNLGKVYGEDDAYYTIEWVIARFGEDSKHIITEANGRFVIEIANEVILDDGTPYIPRDNQKMKYHIKREEGRNAGTYKIFIEKLEGCENYNVSLAKDYYYTISKRAMSIVIEDATIVYKDTVLPGFVYNKEDAEDSLQYDDRFTSGTPSLEGVAGCYVGTRLPGQEDLDYCNVGMYSIGMGSIDIVNEFNEDVSDNYEITVSKGTLEILTREIVVEALRTEKLYGDFDPEIKYVIYHKGVLEQDGLPRGQYTGSLSRELMENGKKDERPREQPYQITKGDLEIINHGNEAEPIRNYLIVEWKLDAGFYINKRKVIIESYGLPDAYYGVNYYEYIAHKTDGNLANNEQLQIDGHRIQDSIKGDLEIIGTPITGVGTYEINCKNKRIYDFAGIDVTDTYYEVTYINGSLVVVPRIFYLYVTDGQHKVYGEDDPILTFTKPRLVTSNDSWAGSLIRRPVTINNIDHYELAGYSYKIELGSIAEGGLHVLTTNEDGTTRTDNYDLRLMGSPTFEILYRELVIEINDVTTDYIHDPYPLLSYNILSNGTGKDGLAVNPKLGINDTISGNLDLSPSYKGCGVYAYEVDSTSICGIYRITGDKLVVTNANNYKITIDQGVLIVNRKVVIVTPIESSLYKIYGEEDKEIQYTIDTEVDVPAQGKLTREKGENAGRYRILINELYFSNNYEIKLNQDKEYYFTILQRSMDVIADDITKIFEFEDPELTFKYIGGIVEGDKFVGGLQRESGEEVGTYAIKRGDLRIQSPTGSVENYNINFREGIFSIVYAELTDLYIVLDQGDQFQSVTDISMVEMYAKFNKGADASDIANVHWNVVKELGNGETLSWEFIKPEKMNRVYFTPNDKVGKYIVTATYKELSATYEIYVSDPTSVGNIYIRHVSGSVSQILGKPEPITYQYYVTGTTEKVFQVEWLLNGERFDIRDISERTYTYDVSKILKPGEYQVQAKIMSVVSEPLTFTIENNNAPVITLKGEPVIYIEAKTGAVYQDEGAVAIDDIDGEVKVTMSGTVNTDVKGTYFIKFDAVDSHGNHAISVYRQVVVRDTIPPEIILNENREMVLLYGQSYVEYGATARDNYDGEVEVIIINPVITTKIGTYEVQYIAYDSSGNRGVEIRYVSVIDNISPVITLIGDEIMYVEVHTPFEDPGARVLDNVDGNFVIQATRVVYKGEIVDKLDTSLIRTYILHYDYTDSAGNEGKGVTRTVVVRDTTKPVISLNGPITYIVRYSYPTVNYVELGATVTDNFDTDLEATITGVIGNELGTYTLYYDAIDSNGNKADTVQRQVVIVDIENPIINFINEDMCPQIMEIEALYEKYDKRCDQSGFGIYVEDDYKEDMGAIQTRVKVTGTVDDTTVGRYIISYDVLDASGNAAATLSRVVIVKDTIAPVLKLIGGEEDGSQIVEVFEDYVEYGVEVYDRYDQHHKIEIKVDIIQNVNVNKLGKYIVTYNARDSHNNRAEPIIRTVYVKDTTPPEITLIGDNPITIERGTEYKDPGATVIDNYDGPMKNLTITGVPSGMVLGKYQVSFKAIDSSGNIGEVFREVNVVDTIPPVVLGVEDGMYYRNPVTIVMVATDKTNEVLTGTLNGEIIPNPCPVKKEGEYQLIVTDDAGNETRIWFAIDITPPKIIGAKDGQYINEDVVISSNEKIRYYGYRYETGNWITVEEQTMLFTKEGVYRVYAVDMAGNISSTITFEIDKTPPVYTLVGVDNKGITETDVNLIVEDGARVVVHSLYSVSTNHVFSSDGYYNVVIKDLAGNTVILQFTINKPKQVVVNNKIITILTQHNAINNIEISGKNYPRDSGYMLVKPLVEGGFSYAGGKLFSEAEYQALISGNKINFGVSPTDDTYMFAAFVVDADELNKFGIQTVEGDGEDDDSKGMYIFFILLVIMLIAGIFLFFLLRRKREEDEEEEEETIVDDYY